MKPSQVKIVNKCPKCGKIIKPGTRVCKNCGKIIADTKVY